MCDISQPTFLTHVTELRNRLIKSIALLLILTVLLMLLGNRLYDFVALPLLKNFPDQSVIIATNVAAPIIVPIKLALFSAVLIAIPFLLWQLWRFIAPGLYKQEKGLLFFVLLMSTALFFIGIAFCFYIVMPLVIKFISGFTSENIQYMPDMSQYLSFTMQMLLAFGLVFEVPIVIIFLNKVGILSIDTLKAWRPYFIVVAFLMGMLLTPPDVISQVLLAIPLIILYEIGILASKWIKKQ